MRKCPFCQMVSDSADVCEWCKRRYSSHFDVLTAIAAATPVKKQHNFVKGSVATIAIVVAVFCLAHIKTSPDATSLVVPPAPKAATAMHILGTVPPSNIPNGTARGPQSMSATSGMGMTQAVGQTAGSTSTTGTSQTQPQSVETPTVRISSVHISTNNNGNGEETAVGTVTMVNTSSYPIVDFRLSMVVNGSNVILTPFAGNAAYPMALSSMSIPPHGSLQVSVTTPSPYMVGELASRSVLVEAHFQGQAQPATDKVFVGAS
ncbi:MAG TPA: hypothetical protein VGL56_01385 [Fimbriimonadaceae bacterium]